MKSASAAVALGLATVAYAQSSTQSAATGIPTNVSQACSSFLDTLNGDTNINSCLAKLVDATSDFNPSSSNGASAASITSVLSTICASSFTACDSSVIRGRLADFYGACQADMLGTNGDGSNGNQSLIDIYDVLYILTPLKNAICAKDGGQYCINKIASGSTGSDGGASSTPGATDNGAGQSSPAPSDNNSGSAAPASGSGSSSAPATTSPAASNTGSASHTGTQTGSGSASAASPSATHARRAGAGGFPVNSLYRRADNTTSQETLGGIAPEAAQYNSIGLPYLFLTPNMTQAELCTTCTSEVVGAYINFETITPYALGIANSPMLSGQIALWNKIKTCPGNFASQLLNNATSSMTGPAPGDSTDAAFAGASLGAVQVVGATLVALVGSMMLF